MTDLNDTVVNQRLHMALVLLKDAQSRVVDITHLVKDTPLEQKFAELMDAIVLAIDIASDAPAIKHVHSDQIKSSTIDLGIDQFPPDRRNYASAKLPRGAYVYVRKEKINEVSDTPWYCYHCFEVEHKISPMNYQSSSSAKTATYHCVGCGSSIEDFPRL